MSPPGSAEGGGAKIGWFSGGGDGIGATAHQSQQGAASCGRVESSEPVWRARIEQAREECFGVVGSVEDGSVQALADVMQVLDARAVRLGL